MVKSAIIDTVIKIEELELELTIFNAKRALSAIDKHLEVKKVGSTTLLLDTKSPNSTYYNRIKGFGMEELSNLDQILETYSKHDIVPCFDLSPYNFKEEIGLALAKHGYVNVEQLAFLQLTLGQGMETETDFFYRQGNRRKCEKVCADHSIQQ